MIKFFSTLIAVLFCATVYAYTAPDTNTIINDLNWQPGPAKNDQCALCNGHFSEPPALVKVPIPPPFKTVPVNISAKGPVIFRSNGTSVLQDDVVVTQPGRISHADEAILYHDKKTGKISKITLIGHVRVQEYGKLLVGDKAYYNLENNTFDINHAIYHLIGQHEVALVNTPVDAWGTAESIHRISPTITVLKNATYSTCPPKDPSWVMHAKKLTLDHERGRGYVRDAVIRFKNVPIFYTPYYSFPMSPKRKSGFFMPDFGSGSGQGFYIGVPYYWNIAPNYDLLVKPEWFSERGLQLNNYFRYLTPRSDGSLYVSFMPDDFGFAQYKQSTLNSYANTPTTPQLQPYLSELQSSSNARGYINFQNNFQLNSQWTGQVYATYVTDPYYAENFQSAFLQQNSNQLPSYAEMDYFGSHWNDTFLIQGYQTLHPIDQFVANTPAQNQYIRVPELDFNAAYPQFIPNYNFDLSSQFVEFAYDSDYYPFTYQRPIGSRIHLQPSISRPFNWSEGYLTPKLTADSINYFSQTAVPDSGMPRANYDGSRTLPIFDIDSGMYFDRDINFEKHDYTETLEPRLFYLYVPYQNQNNYPNFDTQLLPFSTYNLYSLNQFTGYDRLQNANQMSIGLSSRILDATNGNAILDGELGFINYFTTPEVCLVPTDCQIVSRAISPITGTLTWTPNVIWSVTSNVAWDTVLKQVNNAGMGAQYHIGNNRALVFNYQFAHSSPDTPFDSLDFDNNTSLITGGIVWPIIKRWNFFGYEQYNLSNAHPQSQYGGLSYDTCCWALRFVVAQNYTGAQQSTPQASPTNQYTMNYYFQFALKGLGNEGNNNAEGLLTSTLPGFQDAVFGPQNYNYGQGGM